MLGPTELRTDENYVIFYNFLTKTIITELFPYCTLIFLNACIYKEIRRSVKIQQAMRCTQSQKEEIKSANVVVSFTFWIFRLKSQMNCLYSNIQWKALPIQIISLYEFVPTDHTKLQIGITFPWWVFGSHLIHQISKSCQI